MRLRTLTCGLCLLPLLPAVRASPAMGEAAAARVPVVLDTDIGTDVDDAFALAMVIQSHQLQLKAVTTVTGDTEARARVAAKMLQAAGLPTVTVAAGKAQKETLTAQEHWGDGFRSPALSSQPAVEVMKAAIDQERGRMVIIAIGALTNVAALLQQYPAERPMIREIVLMGGSIRHGYTIGSGQTRESNIASDVPAARVVFGSGVPIRMAPLDVTAQLQIDQAQLATLFARGTPLTDSLRELYLLWGQPVPTLHDPMAVSMLTDPALCETKKMAIAVTDDGLTEPVPGGRLNARVALKTDPARFIAYYMSLFRPVNGAGGSEGKSAMH